MNNLLIKSLILISLALFIWTGCDQSNPASAESESNSSWVFVANEGNGCWEEYGDDCSLPGNGSISMIDEFGNLTQIDSLGYTVQSIEVYNNQLFSLVLYNYQLVLDYNK